MSDPNARLARAVDAAIRHEGLTGLKKRAGLEKNYVFRAHRGGSDPKYAKVVPDQLMRLMDALDLTIRPVPREETVNIHTLLLSISDVDLPHWKREVILALVLAVVEI